MEPAGEENIKTAPEKIIENEKLRNFQVCTELV